MSSARTAALVLLLNVETSSKRFNKIEVEAIEHIMHSYVPVRCEFTVVNPNKIARERPLKMTNITHVKSQASQESYTTKNYQIKFR